jgi:uncharacterized protein (TIGR03437 family)
VSASAAGFPNLPEGYVQLISGIATEPSGATPVSTYPMTYAGPAPGLIDSVFQINFQLPAAGTPAALPVFLLAGGP